MRFGIGTDPDGDRVADELTRADITACTLYQATLPVPIRTIPANSVLRRAAEEGEVLFRQVGCAVCHIPALPLNHKGWIYSEPGPYNPSGNLQGSIIEFLKAMKAPDGSLEINPKELTLCHSELS